MSHHERHLPMLLCSCPDCHGEGSNWVDASVWVRDGDGGFDLEPAQNEERCETCGGTGHLTPRALTRLMAEHLIRADRWASRRLPRLGGAA